MAEFEHFNSHQEGTAGVAYAGGAASSAVTVKRQDSLKDPAVERVRGGDRASPKDSDGSSFGAVHAAKRQVHEKERQAQATRECPKDHEPSHTASSQQLDKESHVRTPEYCGSSQSPMASPGGERTTTYSQ